MILKKHFSLFLKDLFFHADFKKKKNIFSSFHAQASGVSTCVPKASYAHSDSGSDTDQVLRKEP